MIRFPTTPREWLIAIVSALAGFFFGGAIVALVQRLMVKLVGEP